MSRVMLFGAVTIVAATALLLDAAGASTAGAAQARWVVTDLGTRQRSATLDPPEGWQSGRMRRSRKHLEAVLAQFASLCVRAAC